jgi:hypothetical protein
MKKLILAAVLGISTIMASTANALILNVEVGDKPYFIHGERYWGSDGAYWCWAPGHWNRRHTVFIHGHYRRCE